MDIFFKVDESDLSAILSGHLSVLSAFNEIIRNIPRIPVSAPLLGPREQEYSGVEVVPPPSSAPGGKNLVE